MSELLNAYVIMHLLNIKSSNIQVLFLDSMLFKDDPLYYFYKNVISNGTEPLFIRNLTKRFYKISSGIHIPYIWDSPCFTSYEIPNCKCKTKTYKYFYDEVIKNIDEFNDSFNYDNETIYYPNIYKTKNLNNYKYNKFITIQWRKVWPKGRKGQTRILGNGPELAEKLSQYLPSNILLRLVDTSNLTIKQQISVMQKTNFLIGVHGAGLTLSIFLPDNSIIQEIKTTFSSMIDHLRMAALSGHKIYSDYIKSEERFVDGNEVIFFNFENFKEKVLEHMNINNFLNI